MNKSIHQISLTELAFTTIYKKFFKTIQPNFLKMLFYILTIFACFPASLCYKFQPKMNNLIDMYLLGLIFEILRNWFCFLFWLNNRVPSLPHIRDFKTSLPHKSHSFSVTNDPSLQHKYGTFTNHIHTLLTRVKVMDLCWSNGFLGLRRRARFCVEMMNRSDVL